MQQQITTTVEEKDPAMPDVSPAIYVALAQAVIGLLVAFGLDVPQRLEEAVVKLILALAVVIPVWDLGVRRARARYFAAKAAQPVITNVVNQERPAA